MIIYLIYLKLIVHAPLYQPTLNNHVYNMLYGVILSEPSIVVATTRPMSNSSTNNKSQEQISSGEHKLCNSQENSTGNHNSILPTIYIKYPWSVLQLCICCAFYPNVHILSSCPLLIFLMSYYSSTIHLSQGQHAVYMCPDIIP